MKLVGALLCFLLPPECFLLLLYCLHLTFASILCQFIITVRPLCNQHSYTCWIWHVLLLLFWYVHICCLFFDRLAVHILWHKLASLNSFFTRIVFNVKVWFPCNSKNLSKNVSTYIDNQDTCPWSLLCFCALQIIKKTLHDSNMLLRAVAYRRPGVVCYYGDLVVVSPH